VRRLGDGENCAGDESSISKELSFLNIYLLFITRVHHEGHICDEQQLSETP
jgi:hypothetical protein